jgi:hypothetical protein
MTDDEHQTDPTNDTPSWSERADLFNAMAATINIDAHGLPRDPSQAFECVSLDRLALELYTTLTDVDTDNGRRVRVGADAWLKLSSACRADRDPAAGAAWIAARAQLPDHWELLGIEPPPAFE